MGVLAVHVDDLVIAGCGRHVKQRQDFRIEISQPNYPEKIPKVPITKEQLNQEEMEVTEETRADLRKTAGAACWLSETGSSLRS